MGPCMVRSFLAEGDQKGEVGGVRILTVVV